MSESTYTTGTQGGEPEQREPESLPVSVRRREDQGTAEIGVTVEGAFVPLTALKLGHLDKLVQLAKDQAEQQKSSEQQE